MHSITYILRRNRVGFHRMYPPVMPRIHPRIIFRRRPFKSKGIWTKHSVVLFTDLFSIQIGLGTTVQFQPIHFGVNLFQRRQFGPHSLRFSLSHMMRFRFREAAGFRGHSRGPQDQLDRGHGLTGVMVFGYRGIGICVFDPIWFWPGPSFHDLAHGHFAWTLYSYGIATATATSTSPKCDFEHICERVSLDRALLYLKCCMTSRRAEEMRLERKKYERAPFTQNHLQLASAAEMILHRVLQNL